MKYVRHYGVSRKNQLFKQRMPEHHQPGVPPQRAQVDEQALPVSRPERLPQRGRRSQYGAVLVKHRERIAQRPAHGLHAISGNRLGLQLVQAPLGVRKLQQTRPLKKSCRLSRVGTRRVSQMYCS